MNDIEKFQSQPHHAILNFGAHIRIELDAEGDPLFRLKDVCDMLELTNSRMVSATLDADEIVQVRIPYVSSNGTRQMRLTTFVTEPGLYRVLNSSRSPKARPFRRWVNHEVLPSIFKTGSYSATPRPATPLPATCEEAELRELMRQIAEHQAKQRRQIEH